MPRRFLAALKLSSGGKKEFLLFVRGRQLERLAADGQIQVAGGIEDRIPDRLGFQALQAKVPEVGVGGVDLLIGRRVARGPILEAS